MTYDPKQHWDEVGRASSPGTGDSSGVFGVYALPAWSDGPQWAEYISPGMRVLDIGSGTGSQAGKLVRAGAWAVGVDISFSLLQVADQNCKLHGIDRSLFVQWNGRDLPFSNETFDCITTNTVLQHVVDDNTVERIFGEAVRTLKRGGQFLISELVSPGESVQTAPHVRLRSVGFYVSLGNRFGLDKVSVSNSTSFYATLQASYGRRNQVTSESETPVGIGRGPSRISTLKKTVSMLAGPIDWLARWSHLDRRFVGQADIVFRKR
jgi:2-polyprenyl-3-methyl-5-hydroxy-6-metoxy-1,4-benzoquinol methylase